MPCRDDVDSIDDFQISSSHTSPDSSPVQKVGPRLLQDAILKPCDVLDASSEQAWDASSTASTVPELSLEVQQEHHNELVSMMHDFFRTMQRHAAERQQLTKTFHVNDRVRYRNCTYIVYGHALIDDEIWAKVHEQHAHQRCLCVKEKDLTAYVYKKK